MIGEYHIVKTGPNAGSLAPCPAEKNCRNGGAHYSLSFLKGLELYTQVYFQNGTKIKDMNPEVIKYFTDNESPEVLASYEKIAKKISGEDKSFTRIPPRHEHSARQVLFDEYNREFEDAITATGLTADNRNDPSYRDKVFKAINSAQNKVAKRYNFSPAEFQDFVRVEGYSDEVEYYREYWEMLPSSQEFEGIQQDWLANHRNKKTATCPECGRPDDGTVMVRIDTDTEDPEKFNASRPVLSCADCWDEIVFDLAFA